MTFTGVYSRYTVISRLVYFPSSVGPSLLVLPHSTLMAAYRTKKFLCIFYRTERTEMESIMKLKIFLSISPLHLKATQPRCYNQKYWRRTFQYSARLLWLTISIALLKKYIIYLNRLCIHFEWCVRRLPIFSYLQM